VCDGESICKPICGAGVGNCADDPFSLDPQSCQTFDPEYFADLLGTIGVCQLRCQPDLQNCSAVDTACFVNTDIGEAQCLPDLFMGGGGPIQGVTCDGDGSGCNPNGCAFGFGPHLSSSSGLTPTHCSQYCTPSDTHTGAPGGAVGGGTGSGFECAAVGGGTGSADDIQCRFVQTALDQVNILDFYGMCVPTDSGNWGDCRSDCDLGDVGACPAGCLKQSTIDAN
jgi:hypothetical protein